ncbi:MAG: hypothetical protein NTW61_07495 [Candidatus Melainabacteria bacterium]|nr:hypothetical protein [Candidatus Melainabacteria bacterium]
MMMMSYKNDSILTIVNRYGKAEGAAKQELYETWDRIRDLAVSGSGLGGSGLGGFSSLLMNIGRTFGSPSFQPILGSESINIPGTSYYAPISGGTGIVPGGQAAFGVAPLSNYTGYPLGGNSGGAAGILAGGASPFVTSTLGRLNSQSTLGIGALNPFGGLSSAFQGVGDVTFPEEGFIGGGAAGSIVGGASVAASSLPGLGSVAAGATGVASGLGFGRNWLMPAASTISGIGGLLTTLGPLFGPIGLAGVAAGGVLNGVAGSILSGFQQVNQRVLSNADTVLGEKVRNLEATMKMLSAQSEILKKMLKDSADGDKKALDSIS